jgi:phage shock protein A
MAADSSGEGSASPLDADKLRRIRYLSKAATAAREDGKDSVAESNFREAISEIQSYRNEVQAVLENVDESSSNMEELEDTVAKLEALEANIKQELKLL